MQQFQNILKHLILVHRMVEFGLYYVHFKCLFVGEGKRASQSKAAVFRRVELILQLAGQKDPSPNIRAVSGNLHIKMRKFGNLSLEQ